MTGEEREGGGDGTGDGGVPPLLSAGTIVGRYRIIQLIGRGGMGVVYRAEHVDLGTLRALKTLAPELAHHPRARSRFLKEAKAAARIEHPHVVKVFDFGQYGQGSPSRGWSCCPISLRYASPVRTNSRHPSPSSPGTLSPAKAVFETPSYLSRACRIA